MFPKGVAHFQVGYKKEGKNLKEILAPSQTKLRCNEEHDGRSGPCGKQCVCCRLLEETTGIWFISVKTGRRYKVRQKINCESKNIVYSVICKQHNVQGVGMTTDLKKRLTNYRSHHNNNVDSCGIMGHFLEEGHQFDRDFLFQPIVKLVNLPTGYQAAKIIRERLEDFELYWQDTLMTIEPNGLNKLEEVEKTREKMKRRKKQ